MTSNQHRGTKFEAQDECHYAVLCASFKAEVPEYDRSVNPASGAIWERPVIQPASNGTFEY